MSVCCLHGAASKAEPREVSASPWCFRASVSPCAPRRVQCSHFTSAAWGGPGSSDSTAAPPRPSRSRRPCPSGRLGSARHVVGSWLFLVAQERRRGGEQGVGSWQVEKWRRNHERSLHSASLGRRCLNEGPGRGQLGPSLPTRRPRSGQVLAPRKSSPHGRRSRLRRLPGCVGEAHPCVTRLPLHLPHREEAPALHSPGCQGGRP